MVTSTILLDLNHIKIQHLHVEFFSLIKHFLVSWITTNRGDKMKRVLKKVKMGITLMC